MAREPLRFVPPDGLSCTCAACRTARSIALQPRPGPTRVSTPEDDQTVVTLEQGGGYATREG